MKVMRMINARQMHYHCCTFLLTILLLTDIHTHTLLKGISATLTFQRVKINAFLNIKLSGTNCKI